MDNRMKAMMAERAKVDALWAEPPATEPATEQRKDAIALRNNSKTTK
jgi:hypothetical protein